MANRQWKLDAQRSGGVVAMNEYFGDRHSDPSGGVGKATGMPGPSGPQLTQRPFQDVRGADCVVNLLRGRCCPTIAQYGESVSGAAGDLSRVEQQRISDVFHRSRRRPLRRHSDRCPSGVVVSNRGQQGQGGSSRGDISGRRVRHAATIPDCCTASFDLGLPAQFPIADPRPVANHAPRRGARRGSVIPSRGSPYGDRSVDRRPRATCRRRCYAISAVAPPRKRVEVKARSPRRSAGRTSPSNCGGSASSASYMPQIASAPVTKSPPRRRPSRPARNNAATPSTSPAFVRSLAR